MTGEEQTWLDCAARMAAAGKAGGARPVRHGLRPGRARPRRRRRSHPGAGPGLRDGDPRGARARRRPSPYSLVSEEAGVSGPADAPWRVVVDPLDGSLNAKRGLEPFAASIAVADGDTLGDVRVAYVEDYTRPRVFSAVRGRAAGTVGVAGPAPFRRGLPRRQRPGGDRAVRGRAARPPSFPLPRPQRHGRRRLQPGHAAPADRLAGSVALLRGDRRGRHAGGGRPLPVGGSGRGTPDTPGGGRRRRHPRRAGHPAAASRPGEALSRSSPGARGWTRTRSSIRHAASCGGL